MEYRTKFGRNAVEGDYVARVSVVQQMWGGASGYVEVGKLHKGYIYYGKSIKRSTALYTDLICVVDPEDLPAYKRNRIEESIRAQEVEDSQKPTTRFFKLWMTYNEEGYGSTTRKITQVTFSKTKTLRKDAKGSDIYKWAKDVYRKQRTFDPQWTTTVNGSSIAFKEYEQEEEFLRDKKNLTWEEKYQTEIIK